MNYKPSDLFVGVVDFFAILLPGALFNFLIAVLFGDYFMATFPLLQSANVAWVAFVFASYFLGHFVYLIGTQLDPLYDATYRRWYDERELASLRERAQMISKNILGEQYNKDDSVLHWATAFVRLRAPSAASEIDRLEGDSKFFRSVTVVLAISSIAFLLRTEWLFGIGCFILCSLSLWRFMERRLKRTQLTYEFFIALTSAEALTSKKTSRPKRKIN